MTSYTVLVVTTSPEPTFGSDISVVRKAATEVEQLDVSFGFDAVVVADGGVSVLKQIRARIEVAALPIFAVEPSLAAHPLADGPVPDDLGAFLRSFEARAGEYTNKLEGTAENTVLSYLWALDTRRLVPSINLETSRIYNYELLSGLGFDAPLRWLAGTEREGLIVSDEVVDRTRNCESCGGAHLNYVDRCPYCDAIDIFAEQAMHCFTCGLVAEEGNFVRGERLVCPKCQTALKHIGTDYDRPIERHRCGDCGERFNDARVKATCLECGAVNAQDALHTQTYRSFRLGPAGESLIRLGHKPAASVQPFGEAIGKEQFLWTLSWLNTLASDPNHSATLAVISMNSLPSDSEQEKGAIASLRAQIGALLSPSEVVHFHGPETILLLLPQDGSTRLNSISNDLKNVSSSRISSDISLAVRGVELPQPGITSDAADWLSKLVGSGS